MFPPDPPAWLREWAAAHPLPEDEPGALDELVRELEDWAPLRRAATAVLLDD